MFLESLGEDMHAFFTSRALQIIYISVISCFTCQLYKFVYYSIKYKRPTWFMLVSTGGFPSSHTSLVVTLTLLLGMLQFHDLGYPDWSFAVSFIVTVITVHDAMGVRLEASKHAKILNNLTSDMTVEEKRTIGFGKKGFLKEMLGHKSFEVAGGIFFGILIGVLGFIIFKNII
jgi:acid phosphatase family membrane protein YuiD